MSDRIIPSVLTLALLVVQVGCSPLMRNRDLGDPAPIDGAPDPLVISPGNGLALTATPLKGVVELGEPVYLALRVANTQDKPRTISGSLRPGEGLVSIFAQGPDGSSVLLTPHGESDFEDSTTLAPGAASGDVFPIFFGANGWSFTKPGVYRVHAELEVPGENGFSRFSSDPATVTVHPSAAGSALLAADRTARVEAGKFLLWRSGDHLQAGTGLLEAISKEHPASAVSAYYGAALVKSLSEPFANYVTGKARAPECERAEELRGSVDFDKIPENLRIEDAIAQAKCFAERRAWDEAHEALGNAVSIAEDRPEFVGLARIIGEMQKRLEAVRD